MSTDQQCYSVANQEALIAKLDGAGHYDEFEIERLVQVELDPRSKQSDLISAIEPVADRLLKLYRAGKDRRTSAMAHEDTKAEADAKDEIVALELFKADLGAYQRLYSFLSQIFDYGSTAVEKRFLF